MITPSPGVSITSLNTLNPSGSPSPRSASLLSIRRLLDCASVFCTSRMQTESIPLSRRLSSMRPPAKKCDLPEPLPPHAPLYRDGAKSGSKTSAVGMRRTDNVSLDHRQRDRAAVFAGQLLRQDGCHHLDVLVGTLVAHLAKRLDAVLLPVVQQLLEECLAELGTRTLGATRGVAADTGLELGVSLFLACIFRIGHIASPPFQLPCGWAVSGLL